MDHSSGESTESLHASNFNAVNFVELLMEHENIDAKIEGNGCQCECIQSNSKPQIDQIRSHLMHEKLMLCFEVI